MLVAEQVNVSMSYGEVQMTISGQEEETTAPTARQDEVTSL